jgi:hypothetical protein
MSDLDKAKKGFEQLQQDNPVVREIVDTHQQEPYRYERPPAIVDTGRKKKTKKSDFEKAQEGFEKLMQIETQKERKQPITRIPIHMQGQYILKATRPPADVKELGLGREYTEYIYDRLVGKPETPTDVVGPVKPRIISQYEERFKSLPDEEKIRFAEKHYDYKPPTPESEKDTGTWWGKAISWFLMPVSEHYQVLKEQFIGTPQYGYKEVERQHDVLFTGIQTSEKIYTDLWKSGDWLGIGGRVISSTPGLVSMSFGIGTVTKTFAVSSIGSKKLFNIGLFKKSVSVTPSKIVDIGITTGFGTSLGLGGVSAFQQGNIKDWMGTMALSFPLVYYGYKSSKPVSKPVVGKEVLVKYGEGGYVEAVGGRKYIELFGKQISYGKKIAFIPKRGTQSFATNIRSNMLIPVKPTGLATYTAIKWGYLPEIFKPQVKIFSLKTNYKQDIFVEPFKKYIPKEDKLSNLVFPKPKVYRAYETYYRYIIINKPWVMLTKKPSYIKIKPFHKTTKDIIKSDKQISKDLKKQGGQIQRDGTITIQKTQTIQTPKIKTETITIPKTLLKPVTRYGYLQEVKLEQKFKGLDQAYKQSYNQMQKQANKLLPMYDTAIGTKKLTKQKKTLLYDSTLTFDIYPLTQPKLDLDKTLKQDKIQIPKIKPILVQTPKLVTPFPTIPKIIPPYKIKTPKIRTPPVKPKPPFIPMIFTDGKSKQQLLIEDEQGFDVYVKDRYIVHGKKKYEERFVKLNRQPLRHSDAMGFGATIVDNSAAASFKIKPTNKKPGKPSIDIMSWGMLRNLFYKRNNTFIERTTHRISTPGEIREISARGWIAEKRKLRPRPMRIIEPKKMKVVKMKDIREMMKVKL